MLTSTEKSYLKGAASAQIRYFQGRLANTKDPTKKLLLERDIAILKGAMRNL